MVEPVNPATRNLVAMALDAANLRQMAHASNIAMANSPGYKPVAVEFEEHLEAVREAIAQGGLHTAHLEGAEAMKVVPAGDVAQPLPLDQEVGAMSRNALHYQALVKLLSKHYGTLALATDGGRR